MMTKWLWKYGCSLLIIVINDNTTFSTIWYLVSTSCSIWLMKYINLCPSWTKATLIMSSLTAMYNNSDNVVSVLHKTKGKSSSSFSCSSFSWHVSSKQIWSTSLVTWSWVWFYLPIFLQKSRYRYQPTNKSLYLYHILQFYRLDLMLLCVSINPRNMPPSTPNTHFFRFSHRL